MKQILNLARQALGIAAATIAVTLTLMALTALPLAAVVAVVWVGEKLG